MEFKFKHPDTGQTKIVTLSVEEIQERLEDQLLDELTCDCEPVGETTVVECGCEDYLSEFVLQERLPKVSRI